MYKVACLASSLAIPRAWLGERGRARAEVVCGPQQELDGGVCADKSKMEGLQVTKVHKPPRDMGYYSKTPAGIIKGDIGPPRVGGTSICLQGGVIRSKPGGICQHSSNLGGNVEIHAVPDLTLELWLRRTIDALNPRETLVSIDSEVKSQENALSIFLTPTGQIDVALSGCSRTVGPCPVGAIRDLEWHHVAISRTSDPSVVNNWTFFVDGSAVWSTRHESVPMAHPSATVLLGKQHGESWGHKRAWRPGNTDKTCFQGNLCHFAFYYRALDEHEVAERYAGFNAPWPDVLSTTSGRDGKVASGPHLAAKTLPPAQVSSWSGP